MCSGLAPHLFLRFHCGCRANLETLVNAIAHAKKVRHTVTITGCLSTQNFSPMKHENDFPLNCAEVEVKFVCGDGFVSSSFEKAKEHVIKSGHVLHVYGRIERPSSSHKKREVVARHPTVRLPRLSKPMWRLEGQKGAESVSKPKVV